MKLLSTQEAAEKLNVTSVRVRQLIRDGKISAHKVGRDYAIEETALDSVKTYGSAGRPKKSMNGSNELFAPEKPKSFAQAAAHLIGSVKSGLPSDLSTNKEYLKDLGKKSAGRSKGVRVRD